MKTIELIGYSLKKVKGRRREVLMICLPPIIAGLFFRLAETAIYSLMLYFGLLTPAGLFIGGNIWQIVIAVIFTLMCWGISAPLWCGTAVRLLEFAGDNSEKSLFSDMLLSGRFIRRSLSSFFMCKLISMVILTPCIISGICTVSILSSSSDSGQLFIASNTGALCIAMFFCWISAKITMSAVPFLLAEYPEKSGIKAVFMSFRFMRGRKKMFVGVGILFFVPFLTVIAIPFIIPVIASAYAVGISIFFKEDEYAGKINYAHRKKRSIARKIRQRGEI